MGRPKKNQEKKGDVPQEEIDEQIRNAEGIQEDSILTDVEPDQKVNIPKKAYFYPANESQALFAIITPNYADLPEETKTSKFGKQLENFQSGHRLGNITPQQAAECLYDFQISAEAQDLGMSKVAAAFTADYTARIEFSHPTKGFRTKYMNYLRQDISDSRKKEKRNAFGKKQEEE